MLRGSLLWLFGVACGIAIALAVLPPGETPEPSTDAKATVPVSQPGDTREPEVADEAPEQAQEPIPEASTRIFEPPRQLSPGETEVSFALFVLADERYIDPLPDAAPLNPGDGPLATLVCDYRSETDGRTVTQSSQYDSQLIPPPSCPYEIRLPLP